LAEIEAGPYNIAVISEWVAQDRLFVQDLGYAEATLARFSVSRPRMPYQLDDVRDASEVQLAARRFISDAFLSEDDANYPLTAAIAQVFTESDFIDGIRYPSLAVQGRADNFALTPDCVRTKMRLEAASYYWLKTASADGAYDFNPIADLSEMDDGGSLSWVYRDHVSVIPPGASLPVGVTPGDRLPFQISGPSSVMIDNRRYDILPGAFLEICGNLPIVKCADGTIVEGTEVAETTEEADAATETGKSPAALANDAISRLKEYQSVLAIAVRSREIASMRVSVATAVTLGEFDFDETRWTCKLRKQSAIEFHEPKTVPDYIAWWTYVCAAQESHLPLPALLIVEGGVQTLAAINARVEPLIGEKLLPNEFTLAWGRATSDPTNFVSSRALGECARDATDILAWIAAHPSSPTNTFKASEYCSCMRVWAKAEGVPEGLGDITK
jgi:hypothetical protein